MSGTFRVRERFAKFRTCSSSPCNSNIFCSNRKPKSFRAGVLQPSEVSTFSSRVALSFMILLVSSILAFPLLLGSFGGEGSGGPLDLVWYVDDASMHEPTLGDGNKQIKKERKEKANKSVRSIKRLFAVFKHILQNYKFAS